MISIHPVEFIQRRRRIKCHSILQLLMYRTVTSSFLVRTYKVNELFFKKSNVWKTIPTETVCHSYAFRYESICFWFCLRVKKGKSREKSSSTMMTMTTTQKPTVILVRFAWKFSNYIQTHIHANQMKRAKTDFFFMVIHRINTENRGRMRRRQWNEKQKRKTKPTKLLTFWCDQSSICWVISSQFFVVNFIPPSSSSKHFK